MKMPQSRANKRSMGLVDLLVALNHLPYDTQLSFMPNGNVADAN